MKKKKLYIAIPEPCNQDWENMEAGPDGRFCTNCSKTVVDFSQMTDGELFNYFKLNRTIPCGRFHNTQLNINLSPAVKQIWFPAYLKKIAAAIATVISLKAYSQDTVSSPQKAGILQNPGKESRDNLPEKNTSISGTIKDSYDKPIKNAKISLVRGIDAYTNNDGKFFIDLKNEMAVPQTIVFSFDDLMPVVRSYHPAMQDALYNIVLYTTGECISCSNITMGIPVQSTVIPIDFPGLYFGKKTITLSPDARKSLAMIADRMKENPAASLMITAYPNKLDPKQKISDERLNSILNYLIEKLGISSDRLNTDKLIDGGDFNIIDFKTQ